MTDVVGGGAWETNGIPFGISEGRFFRARVPLYFIGETLVFTADLTPGWSAVLDTSRGPRRVDGSLGTRCLV